MKKNTDILNKLRYETENTNIIHLWLEGMFWKAYERSAYLFVHRISGYKPYKKFVKAVGGEVVAIGFPAKSIDKLLEGRSVERIDDKHYILSGFTIDVQELRNYQTWKKKVPSFPYHIIEEGDEKNELGEHEIEEKQVVPLGVEQKKIEKRQMKEDQAWLLVDEIQRFRMESATPLECMMFLAQLIKKSLDIRRN